MERRPGRPFASITRADLEDNGRLGLLYLEAVSCGWWRAGNAQVLEFWCFAEKALEEDREKTAGKLFHWLVKAKDPGRVTNAQEIRAQSRMDGDARESLALRAEALEEEHGKRLAERPPSRVVMEMTEAGQEAFFGDPGIGFQHAAFMQVFLPQKRPQAGHNEHVVRHGRARLKVVAGEVADENEEGGWRRCTLPFGSRARVILPYINGCAVRGRTRQVDLGYSVRDLMRRLGLGYDGRLAKVVQEQVEAIAAADFRIGLWRGDAVVTKYGRIAEVLRLWNVMPAVGGGRVWEPTLMLSDSYYNALVERPVPVDLTHLARLAKSPRRMDLYSWLSYRTAVIGPRGKVVIKLDDLREIFAPDIARGRKFRERFVGDLAAVAKVYGGFRVEVLGDKLVLRRSRPPVRRPLS